jgi:hypothetical protein
MASGGRGILWKARVDELVVEGFGSCSYLLPAG